MWFVRTVFVPYLSKDSDKGTPQNLFCGEKEEQGSERSFRRKVETELSGLCDDERKGCSPLYGTK